MRLAILWLFVASSWFVIVEPAPYEVLFLLAAFAFFTGGLHLSVVLVPLVVFLILYNLGGAFSVVQVAHLPKTVQFTVVSFYMAVTAIFFAAIVLRSPATVMPVIRSAYIFATVPACIFAFVGYLNIAGMGETLSPLGRAQGTFKDPNVLSTFLILPMMFLIYGFVEGTQRFKIISLAVLLLIAATVFLAFSRGAWLNTIVSAGLMLGIAFVVSPSARFRSRIVLFTIFGVVLAAGLLTFILSFSAVRELFFERAAIIQPYDAGETGRFGNQLRSLSMLIEAPNGLGPFGFARTFGEDPHNVYLNAFSAYGWLGGLSYLLLAIATVAACWRAVFTVSPFQRYAIPVVAVLLATMMQGIQIDTDHWRHFYLLLGVAWGLCAVTYLPANGQTSKVQTGR